MLYTLIRNLGSIIRNIYTPDTMIDDYLCNNDNDVNPNTLSNYLIINIKMI